MIVVRLDRRPRATRSDSESLRPQQALADVDRPEGRDGMHRGGDRVHDGRQDRRHDEPLPGCAQQVLPPKEDLDQPQAARFRQEAGVALRAEFHRRRQARQDKYRRQEQ